MTDPNDNALGRTPKRIENVLSKCPHCNEALRTSVYWDCGIAGHRHYEDDTALRCIQRRSGITKAAIIEKANVRFRQVLAMRAEGLTYRQIAAKLGRSTTTAGKLVCLAERKKARGEL